MKKIILYLIIVLAFCNCKKEKSGFNAQEIKDINDIVEAVINQDSLDVFSKTKNSKTFCTELRKLKLYTPPKKTDENFILLPKSDGVYISEFIQKEINGYSFFSPKDSIYLLNQNSNPSKLKIEKKIIQRLNTTTIEKEMAKRKKGQNYRFYEMTIPIFSLDRQKAHVQLDYSCGGLCGHGNAIYLKKINGKWIIVEKWGTWIS